MAKEDLLLGVEMGKLEIEPTKVVQIVKDENPFVQTSRHKSYILYKKNISVNNRCSCLGTKATSFTICKKRNSKIIKDPVLKILQTSKNSCQSLDSNLPTKPVVTSNSKVDVLSLCALVDNCNQLRISSTVKKHNVHKVERAKKHNWWQNNVSQSRQAKPITMEKSQTGSCSQQALNPPCDVTIDELASYFETLVHIPKKMSSMAEMMYI